MTKRKNPAAGRKVVKKLTPAQIEIARLRQTNKVLQVLLSRVMGLAEPRVITLDLDTISDLLLNTGAELKCRIIRKQSRHRPQTQARRMPCD